MLSRFLDSRVAASRPSAIRSEPLIQSSSAPAVSLEWYASTPHGHGSVRVSNGLRIGEDESGDFVLNPAKTDMAVVFEISEGGALRVRAATSDLEFELPRGRRSATLAVEPGRNTRIHLPNSIICLSSSPLETGSLSNDLDDLVSAFLVPRQTPERSLPDHPLTVEDDAALRFEKHAPAELDEDRDDPLHAEMVLAEPLEEQLEETVPTLSDAIPVEPSRSSSLTAEPGGSASSSPSEAPVSESHVTGHVSAPEPPERTRPVLTTDAKPPTSPAKRRLPRLPIFAAVAAAMAITTSVLWEQIDLPLPRAAGSADVAEIAGSAVADKGLPGGALASQAQTRPAPTSIEIRPQRVVGSQPLVGSPTTDASPTETSPTTEPTTAASSPQPPAVPALATELTVSPSVAKTAPRAEEVRLLADAQALFQQGDIVDPPGRNAVATLVALLKLNPENEGAMALMFDCTVRLLDEARDAVRAGEDFQARNIVEEVLAFHPSQPDALQLWEELVGRPYRTP